MAITRGQFTRFTKKRANGATQRMVLTVEFIDDSDPEWI